MAIEPALALLSLPLLAIIGLRRRVGSHVWSLADRLPASAIRAYLVLVLAFWVARNLPFMPFRCLAP